MSSVGTLYATDGPLSRTVNAVIAYTGLTVDRPPYKHFEDNKLPPFLKDFPHGKIPAFKTKSGVPIFEGAAIACYLAAIAPESGLLPPSLEDQALVDQWVHLIDTEVFAFAFLNWLWCNNRLGPYHQEFSDALKERENRALNTINKHLEGRTYLVGDNITLADITLATVISITIIAAFETAKREQFPNVVQHYERLAKLPSLSKILGCGI